MTPPGYVMATYTVFHPLNPHDAPVAATMFIPFRDVIDLDNACDSKVLNFILGMVKEQMPTRLGIQFKQERKAKGY